MGVGYAAPISPIGAPTAASAEHVGPYLGHRVEALKRHVPHKDQLTAERRVANATSMLPAASQVAPLRDPNAIRPGVSIDLSGHVRSAATPRASYQEAVRGARKSVGRPELRLNRLNLHQEVPDIHGEDSTLPDKAIATVRQRDLETHAPVQVHADKHAQAETLAKFSALQEHMATRAASDPRSLARPKIGLTTAVKANAPAAKETLVDALISVLTGIHSADVGVTGAAASTAAEAQVDAAVRSLVRSLHANTRGLTRSSVTETVTQPAAQSAFYALKQAGLQPQAARSSTRIALAA